MTIEIHNVGALRVWSESSFATDGSGTLANYTYVPFREGSATMTLTMDSLDPQQTVQSRVEYRKEVLGKRSATLQFTCNLAPTGTAAGSATAAVTGAMGTILKAVFGGENKGTGTTFTGGTAAVPTVTSAAGFAAGSAIGWVNASGILEVREIESISGTSITLKFPFSDAPANAEVAYASATYYFTEDPSESLQFLVEGVESTDRWLLLGGQAVGGVTLTIDPSGAALPSIAFNLTFADYKTSAETAGSITGTLSDATYSNYQPIVGYAGELRCIDVGAATLSSASLIHCSALALTPKVVFVPVPSPSGTNTVYRWRAGRAAPPAEGSFTTFFEDLTWWTARDNRTDKAVFYTMGTAAGSTVMVSEPTVQIVNPQRAAAGELAGQTVAFKARRDTDVGVSTTALAKSPFRIHLV
jgi:hypothetical protein